MSLVCSFGVSVYKFSFIMQKIKWTKTKKQHAQYFGVRPHGVNKTETSKQQTAFIWIFASFFFDIYQGKKMF